MVCGAWNGFNVTPRGATRPSRSAPRKPTGDHHAHGIRARSRSRGPGGLSSSRAPSSAATRSSRPRSPEPCARTAPPTPSSHTSTTARGLGGRTRTPRSPRVLRDVRQRLADHEVGGRSTAAAGRSPASPRPRPGPARVRRGPLSAARAPGRWDRPGGCRAQARAARRGRAPPARRSSKREAELGSVVDQVRARDP